MVDMFSVKTLPIFSRFSETAKKNLNIWVPAAATESANTEQKTFSLEK